MIQPGYLIPSNVKVTTQITLQSEGTFIFSFVTESKTKTKLKSSEVLLPFIFASPEPSSWNTYSEL